MKLLGKKNLKSPNDIENKNIKTIKKKLMLPEDNEDDYDDYEEIIDYEFYFKKSNEEISILLKEKSTPFKLKILLRRIIQRKIRKK